MDRVNERNGTAGFIDRWVGDGGGGLLQSLLRSVRELAFQRVVSRCFKSGRVIGKAIEHSSAAESRDEQRPKSSGRSLGCGRDDSVVGMKLLDDFGVGGRCNSRCAGQDAPHEQRM